MWTVQAVWRLVRESQPGKWWGCMGKGWECAITATLSTTVFTPMTPTCEETHWRRDGKARRGQLEKKVMNGEAERVMCSRTVTQDELEGWERVWEESDWARRGECSSKPEALLPWQRVLPLRGRQWSVVENNTLQLRLREVLGGCCCSVVLFSIDLVLVSMDGKT